MSAARASSVRTCIGCRTKGPPGDLLRVVLEAGTVVPDPGAIRQGRGAWLHPACLGVAERRRAFTRALRATAGPDLSVLREYVGRTPQ